MCLPAKPLQSNERREKKSAGRHRNTAFNLPSLLVIIKAAFRQGGQFIYNKCSLKSDIMRTSLTLLVFASVSGRQDHFICSAPRAVFHSRDEGMHIACDALMNINSKPNVTKRQHSNIFTQLKMICLSDEIQREHRRIEKTSLDAGVWLLFNTGWNKGGPYSDS